MIKQLRIHQLRNLSEIDLNLAKCTLIIGQNGSGKTSLLEAVFLLSRGKSFRHHEAKRYITHTMKSCAVWAKTCENESLAIQKLIDASGKSEIQLRYQGDNTTQSTLSFNLPTLLIDPLSMSMLDEGSGQRRQLLDWLAFHVKLGFYEEWLHYQRLLKQRNSLLKQPGIHRRLAEITAWDWQLSTHAANLHAHRLAVFTAWQSFFDEIIAQLLPAYAGQISLHYQAGFDSSASLLELLSARVMQDIELGYTRIGAHRADVVVYFKGESAGKKWREQATHVLSRGEKKLLITALKLSQLQLICALLTASDTQVDAADIHTPLALSDIRLIRTPVVLIDDIDAELDENALDILLATVLSLPCQTLITSLNPAIKDKILTQLVIKSAAQPNPDSTIQQADEMPLFSMFHVKQGVIS